MKPLILILKNENGLTYHMLITTFGVQQQMNASTISTVILSVLALARLKCVDLESVSLNLFLLP
jgi:hypothetical protein